MPTNATRGILYQLRTMLSPGRAGLKDEQLGLTDAQLLANFLNYQDDTALEVLIRRHGPMVWGVCRRILRNYHDAEDAFQATFLVLVRKAGSLRQPELVSNWLYGVASKTAWDAKALAIKRSIRERQMKIMPDPELHPHERSHDWQVALDQELHQLRHHYRAVIILCDLEGCSRKEAARQLNVPEATVATRLARGRQRLAQRLARRGVTVPAGTLASVLVHQAASAHVPMELMNTTIHAARLFALGPIATGTLAPQVITLTQGVLKAMCLNKLKMWTLGLASLMLGGWLLVAAAPIIGRIDPALGQDHNGITRAWSSHTPLSHTVGSGLPTVADQDTAGIDAKIIAAWEKAGATFGWVWHDDFGVSHFERERPKDRNALPGFSVSNMRLPPAQTLPIPAVPFALNSTGREGAGFVPQLPGRAQASAIILDAVPLAKADLEELASLKQLRLLSVSDSQLPDAGLELLTGLAQLQSLYLRGTQISDTGLKAVARFRQLQTLNLRGTPISDAGLNELAVLKELQVLSLVETAIGDKGLKVVGGLGQLQVLNLWATPTTDAGLRELTGLKQLRKLTLWGTQITDAGMKDLARLKQLQFLDLENTQISDASLKELAGMKMKWLNLPRDARTDLGLKHWLAAIQVPTELKLGNWKITDVGLKELAGLKDVQSLLLASQDLTDEGLRHLAGLTRLQMLYLPYTQITDDGLKIVTGMKQLKQLYLYDSPQITDLGLKHLAGLKQLQMLHISKTQIGDAGLKELAKLQRLETLYLNETQISDAGLKELTTLKQLQYLNLTGTQVTDAGLGGLAGLKLKDLEIPPTAKTDIGLKNWLAATQSIHLYLKDWEITDLGLKEVASHKQIQRISLHEKPISDAGLKALAGLKQLEWLDLQDTAIGDAGLKELAGLDRMDSLNLENTRITNMGLKELVGLNKLQWLNLRGTMVNDAGLKALAGHKQLLWLGLQDTQVTEVGVAELRKALPTLGIQR